MHIGIVAGSLGWHVRDLQRAAGLLGIQTNWVDITRLSSADDLHDYDALLIRTFPSGSLEQTIFRLSLLYRAEREGQRIINSPAAFEACVDKFSTTSRLQAAGVPVPATVCCQTLEAAMEAYDALEGDVVIKPIFGSEGKGLMRVTNREAAWRACSMLMQCGAVAYLQEFIPHPGHDLRVFVLDGKPLAAMRRRHPSDWRTNLAQGAVAERVELHPDAATLAVQAAACVGAEVAGVDLLPAADGQFVVIEVNGVPGWQGLAKVTGMDVAMEVLRYVANL